MARIIDPSAAERPTPRQVGGIAQLRNIGPSDAAAQGMRAMGQELERGAEELFVAQKVEEDRVNTLRAEEAFTKLRERQLDLSIGETNGFTRVKGSAAVSRPLLPEYTKRFNDAEGEIATGLSNDEQRQRFKTRAGVARLQYQEEILRHLAREGDTFAKEVYEGTIAVEQRSAVERWNSPNDIDSSLERIKATVDARAERYSWPAEYKKAMLQQEAGKVHSAVIGQAIASNDYVYAQAWYDKHKGEVDLPTAKALEKAVEDGTQKQLTAGYNRDFLAQRESKKGLEDLAKRVVGDDKLDETRKNIVHGRIINRIETLDLRAERQRLQVERQIGKLITDANSNTLAGMPSTVEQLTPIYEAAKGSTLEPEARQMVAIANATGAFSKLAPIQQANEITAAEAQIRKDPGKFDRRVLDAWKQIHERQGELLKKDHITFAFRQGIADPVPVDLSQPVQAADALAERFAISDSLSAKYGSPNRPLTEPEQQLVSRAVGGAGWQEKRDYLGQLFQASRGNVQGYSNIMGQLAADHPLTAMAGEFAAKGRTRASELILQGDAILRPNTKTDGKTDGSSLRPMPPETMLRAEFDNIVRGAYPESATRNTVYQATKAIYAKLAAGSDDTDSKAPDLTRWKEAIDLATGGILDYNGKYTPLPYGMDGGQFKDQMRRRLEDLQEAGGLPPGTKAAQLAGLPIQEDGDGRYFFPIGDKALMVREQTAKGVRLRRLVIDFNQSPAFRPSGYKQAPSSDTPPSVDIGAP